MTTHTYTVDFDGAQLDEIFDSENDTDAREEFAGFVAEIERNADDTPVGELVMRDETGREVARHLFY